MTRFSLQHRIFFIEEPVLDSDRYYFEAYKDESSDVTVITPHLPPNLESAQLITCQKTLIGKILDFYRIDKYVVWHYSPMSYAFSAHLRPLYRVYDCMDELSNFLFAPPALKENEAGLLEIADIVFTGGNSLYEAKRSAHNHIFSFPSSIDKAHFGKARELRCSGEEEPIDQRRIGGPRLGFFGVIDERLNSHMLRELAELRPNWQYILIGPVVKIDPASLPAAKNIHYLGAKPYGELPRYLAGWDIAMMPFALNASTMFISPTKTPEYLAGGVPVVAPSVKDIVTPYFHLGLVAIADTAEAFIEAAEQILAQGMAPGWQEKVDDFLFSMSWDRTVEEMARLIEAGIRHRATSIKNTASYV